MQKLICKDGKISTSQADGAWQAYYDGGPQAPCIKLGHGTGSTPTLMGFGQDKDKLVVITDGSKRMKLVAFWRDEIPSDAQQVAGYDKRIAGVHEVTCGLGTSTEWIQSEQSVVVGGYDAFVVNNINVTNQEINDKIIGVIAIGPIVKGPQGAECVRWNTKEKKWESKWTRSDVSSVSMKLQDLTGRVVPHVTAAYWARTTEPMVPTPSFSILLTATFYSTLLPDQSA